MTAVTAGRGVQPHPAAGEAVHHYRAYGCLIASAFPLPELPRAEIAGPFEPDLTIMAASLDLPMPSGPDERFADIGPQRSRFSWNGFGRVSIEDGRRILVDLLPEFDPALLGFVLLGPVLAATLHGRGMTVLHGSAVAPPQADAGAFILLGDSGAGKSTFAAACLAAGCHLVNDDVAAIHGIEQGRPFIEPGFPSLKLSQATLAMLDPLPGQLLPKGAGPAAKLRLRLPDEKIATKRTIQRICILQRGDALRLDPLSPTDGLQALMRYSYLPKLGANALSGAAAARHFARCAALAGTLPVSMLTVPSSLEGLRDAAWRLTALQERTA